MLELNKVYLSEIVRIEQTYVIVKVGQIQGICHISEISDYRIKSITDYFREGQSCHFVLIDYDQSTNRYGFSYKRIHPRQLKYHYAIIDSIKGYKNLYDNTMRELNK